MHRRQQAREFARHHPVLARDLNIGRPDVPHDYDDGGLVDVNQVPGAVLASCLGLTPAESAAVIAARDQLGRFSSPEELSAYAQLPPDRVEALRDWMMFG
jgi:DNA uptake protein ComE-like DNA-binding protein